MSSKSGTVAALVVLAGLGLPSGIACADPTPQPKTTIDQDGTYAVGTDIVPGTYSSAGPVGAGTCYWKRLGGTNGSDVIDNAMSHKPQVVQIEPTDKAFKTDGCQPWQMDPGAEAASPPPGNGIDALNGFARQLGGALLPPA